MPTATLSPQSRAQALTEMSQGGPLDILVIGGGVTGAGIALDAVTRGLRVGIVEAQDWAAGTSSRSSKLVHGGLRYLYQLDFKLVAEALSERGLLLETTAPHLVKKIPLLWPFQLPVIERAYSTLGVGTYDVMAQIAHPGSVPIQRHCTKTGALKLFPDLRDDSLSGAMVYYDARVDDSRLVINLVRTSAKYGALAANRTQVVQLHKNPAGQVSGATIRDLETGTDHEVSARCIINATGVWTEKTQALSQSSGGLQVLASKGIHIVVPKSRIKGTTGLFLRTEKSVLFIIPWKRYWIIGTTDTKYHEDLRHPVANATDIEYILEHVNSVLKSDLTQDDIIGTFAGLRPLLQPGTLDGDKARSTKVSREHTVTEAAPGLVVIAGGKLTTYRTMAQDAVDFALGKKQSRKQPSVTKRIVLSGAEGYRGLWNTRTQLARTHGLSTDTIEDLLDRYGSDIDLLFDLFTSCSEGDKPLGGDSEYLRAEVLFGVLHEGALHLEDILLHRIRLNYERKDRGLSLAQEITEIMGQCLGWSQSQCQQEMDLYQARCQAEEAAEGINDEAQAQAVRDHIGDPCNMVEL